MNGLRRNYASLQKDKQRSPAGLPGFFIYMPYVFVGVVTNKFTICQYPTHTLRACW
jgi:hypothetical protein